MHVHAGNRCPIRTRLASRRTWTLSLAAATMSGAVEVAAAADEALGPAPLASWISLLGRAPSTAVSSLHAFSWVNQSVRCSSLRGVGASVTGSLCINDNQKYGPTVHGMIRHATQGVNEMQPHSTAYGQRGDQCLTATISSGTPRVHGPLSVAHLRKMA